MNRAPAPELVAALEGVAPGKALDLACGEGRHTIWLRERGWDVTAVDRDGPEIRADLELGEFVIAPDAYDLIVCWLYWQPDFMPSIAAGARMVAIAGKTIGRFAVSLARLRAEFPGWSEMASGENEVRCFLVVRREELID